MWILTEEYNLYAQEGEYFVATWLSKSSVESLEEVLETSELFARHLLSGGGRRGYEAHWYNLREYEEGTRFE